MNFERPEDTVEQELSEARLRLKELENSGDFLFHGSPLLLDKLETRQPYTYENDKRMPDGAPSVVSSPFADVAIFRALVSEVNIPIAHRSGFGMISSEAERKINFRLSSTARPHLEGKHGYVYVLPRDSSNPYKHEKGMEWRSEKDIEPLEVIEVSDKDLPSDINLLED